MRTVLLRMYTTVLSERTSHENSPTAHVHNSIEQTTLTWEQSYCACTQQYLVNEPHMRTVLLRMYTTVLSKLPSHENSPTAHVHNSIEQTNLTWEQSYCACIQHYLENEPHMRKVLLHMHKTVLCELTSHENSPTAYVHNITGRTNLRGK